MTFGLGLIPEDRAGLPPVAHLPVMRLGDLPPDVSLAHRVRRVRLQPGSSCVGNAFASAIEIRAGVLGVRIPDVSALAIYTMAREAWGTSIADVGCRARDAADALEQRGIVSEERWPTGSAHLNELLPWDVFGAGLGARVDGLYRVDGAEAIRGALAAGYPVAFGMFVDQAYYAYQGGTYAPGGARMGGHMQTIIGYEPGRFRVLNSWGDGWGEGGYSWLLDRDVESGFDHYAIRLVPEGVA